MGVKVLLCIYLLVLPLTLFGQMTVVKEGDVYKIKFKEAGSSSDTERRFIVKGHPYLTEQFKLGRVIVKGKSTQKLLRYDAYHDKFEWSDTDEKTVEILKTPDISVEFEGNTYSYLSYIDHGNEKWAYLNPLNEGATQLLVQKRKTILPFKKPDHGYEVSRLPEFIEERTYFIKRKNKPAVPLAHLSRKEVFAVLWDKYSELRKYARNNKLHMRDEEEVIQVLSYYDSLKVEK